MKTLYVTYCSGKKKHIEKGTPEQLYDSERISDFISVCKSNGYDWAILSAKYGLFFPHEVKENYNVTFKSVAHQCRIVENGKVLSDSESRSHIDSLIERVSKCILDDKIEKVIFYCGPPLKWRKCYLHVLHEGVDDCKINHETWDNLLKHIEKMYSNGTGKICILTKLKDLTACH